MPSVRFRIAALAALALSGSAASPSAAQTSLRLDADPAQSSLSVVVEFSGVTVSDASPASGFVVIQLDDESAPTSGVLLDFRFEFDETINLVEDLGFLGSFVATGENIALFDAAPCEGAGPAAVAPNGDVTVMGVMARTEGQVNYTASGVPCVALGTQGLPCMDMIDLAVDFPDAVDGSLSGNLVVAGGVATLTTPVNVFNPFDPLDPAAGGISIVGTIVSSGPLGQACSPADLGPANGANCQPDGAVGLSDFSLYLSRWANGDPAADITPSGTCLPGQGGDGVDLSDFSCFLSVWASGCP